MNLVSGLLRKKLGSDTVQNSLMQVILNERLGSLIPIQITKLIDAITVWTNYIDVPAIIVYLRVKDMLSDCKLIWSR